MINDGRSKGNLWHGVQAIAQKRTKSKNNLYHIYGNVLDLLSTIPVERQWKRVPREKVRN